MLYLTEKGLKHLDEVIQERRHSGIESITVWRTDFRDFPWLEERLCRLIMSGRVLVIEQATHFMTVLDVVPGSCAVLYCREVEV